MLDKRLKHRTFHKNRALEQQEALETPSHGSTHIMHGIAALQPQLLMATELYYKVSNEAGGN